jgi:hypothetical protein
MDLSQCRRGEGNWGERGRPREYAKAKVTHARRLTLHPALCTWSRVVYTPAGSVSSVGDIQDE